MIKICVMLFVILSIVFFIGLLIHGIMQPRNWRFDYDGACHWDQPEGSEKIVSNAYFGNGPSLKAFKEADNAYKEKETN